MCKLVEQYKPYPKQEFKKKFCHCYFVKAVTPITWGQPTIYFAIGDHVNVSWCRSHTNASGVMAT